MTKRISGVIFIGVLTLIVTGCSITGGSKNQVSTTTNTPAAAASNLPDVTGPVTSAPTISAPRGNPPTTLVTKDIVVGTGAAAVATSTMTVHYTLMAWSTGKVLESSWTGASPATFPLANVIPGWQKGIPGMQVGGRRLLVIPPDLGYGTAGSGPVGPNETLIFVVDVIAIS